MDEADFDSAGMLAGLDGAAREARLRLLSREQLRHDVVGVPEAASG